MRSENISTPIHVQLGNVIRRIDQRFAFKNSGISCLALIFNLSSPRTTVLYAKKSVGALQVAKYDESYALSFEQWIVLDTNLCLSG